MPQNNFTDERLASQLLIFGQNVRNARKDRDLGAKELAQIIGISAAYMGLIERGERRPSLDIFMKICWVLEHGCDEMMSPKLYPSSTRQDYDDDERKFEKKLKATTGLLSILDLEELQYINRVVKDFISLRQHRS